MSNTTSRQCPIAGCGLDIPMNVVMCGKHWRMVPRSTQQAVYRAWGSRRKHGTDSTIAQHEATKRLAIEGVNAMLAPRANP